MGNCGGKTKDMKSVEDVEDKVPSELTLRKKKELQAVVEADSIKIEEGGAWYIVEAAWVQKWLAYVQGNDSARKPGPIRNETLLIHDKAAGAWVPRPLLRAARKEHMGHYRRVNPHVWNMWTQVYRGSGPTIWVAQEPFEDSSNWQFDRDFNGVVAGRGGRGGSKEEVRERLGAEEGEARVEPSGEAWRQPPTYRLAIGEMEDAGVGEETTAQAAAFFDVALSSPSAAGGAGGALAGGRSNGNSDGKLGSRGGASSGRHPGSNSERMKEASSAAVAEAWMYGDVGGGPTGVE